MSRNPCVPDEVCHKTMATNQLFTILSAHTEAQGWVISHKNEAVRELWETCPQGDWLLWLASRIGIPRQSLVLAACACARLTLPYAGSGEKRPLAAIEAAEAWTQGEATSEQVKTAAIAAVHAARAAGRTASAGAAVGYAAACAASSIELGYSAGHIVSATLGCVAVPANNTFDAAAYAAVYADAAAIYAAAVAADTAAIYVASYARVSAFASQTYNNSRSFRDTSDTSDKARAFAHASANDARGAIDIAFAAADVAYVATDAAPPTLAICADLVRTNIAWELVEATIGRSGS